MEKDKADKIKTYLVKTKFSLRAKFGKTLSIDSSQVIKITATEIVVNDSYVQEPNNEIGLITA